MKAIHEKVFEEISVLILDNLELLYNYNDDTLLDIRKYCYENKHHRYKPLPYNILVSFTKKAMSELLSLPYLYDFRDLE